MHLKFGMNIKQTNAYEDTWIYYIVKEVNHPEAHVTDTLVAIFRDVLKNDILQRHKKQT